MFFWIFFKLIFFLKTWLAEVCKAKQIREWIKKLIYPSRRKRLQPYRPPSLFKISSVVISIRFMSSTANAGYPMTVSKAASVSLDKDSLGNMLWRTARHFWISSVMTWMTEEGPPRTPNKSNSSIASKAAMAMPMEDELSSRMPVLDLSPLSQIP
jgi:hypothetical protein